MSTASVVPSPTFTDPVESTSESAPFVGMLGTGADLDRAGYVQHEYFVSGTGAVYGPGKPDSTDRPTLSRAEIVPMGAVATPDVPYTTRILVRAPADPSKMSGTVHIEAFHNQGEIAPIWSMSHRHMIANGDAWVGATVSTGSHVGMGGTARGGVEMLKQLDPERYQRLVLEPGNRGDWPLLAAADLGKQLADKELVDVLANSAFTGSGDSSAFGVLIEEIYRTYAHSYDAITQIAHAIRTRQADSPFATWPVERLYAAGASGTAIYWSAYVDGGHHQRARLAGGAPVINAYVNFVATSPLTRFDDAVVVSVLSEAEVMAAIAEGVPNPPDTDTPPFRQYQFPGAGHGISGTGQPDDLNPATPALEAEGLRPFDRVNYPIIHAIWRHLERLVRDGVPMPKAEPIMRDPGAPDGVARDEFGNARGGLRTPWVEVPNAQYFARSPGNPLAACYRPFTQDEMRATYGDRDVYVKRFRARVAELVDAGWTSASEAELFDPGSDFDW